MSNEERVRINANKYHWNRYFLKHRPVSIGTQPRNGFMDFINYDKRTNVEGKLVWAELYYNRKLSEKEMEEYEIEGGIA